MAQRQLAAAQFLIKVATEQTADSELRKMAVARLGEIAGEQALGTLKRTATATDADTELQKQAVTAIARRPASESVPLLINIAKTHPKPEVRKAGGVYYTPKYIVDYIVQNTVGQLIAGKTPSEIAKLRFADIACG